METELFTCPHCHSKDVDVYGDNMFCNRCRRTSRVAIISDDLDEK